MSFWILLWKILLIVMLVLLALLAVIVTVLGAFDIRLLLQRLKDEPPESDEES